MVYAGMEQPFERGESGSKSYLDHEATTSTGGGSSQYKIIIDLRSELNEGQLYIIDWAE